MKHFILTLGLAAISIIGWGQVVDTLYAKADISHMVTIWDTPNIKESKSIGYIKHIDGVVAFVDKVYGDTPQYYMLADSSGYVTLNNQFTTEKIEYNYSQNTKESLGWVLKSADPCAQAEYYRQKYINTSSMTDFDAFRKWTAKCMDKKY